MSKLLASLMRNYFPKRPSGAPLHTLSKLYDVPVGFVTPPHPILRLNIAYFAVAEGWLLLDIGWFVLFLQFIPVYTVMASHQSKKREVNSEELDVLFDQFVEGHFCISLRITWILSFCFRSVCYKTLTLRFFTTITQHMWQCKYEIDFVVCSYNDL